MKTFWIRSILLFLCVAMYSGLAAQTDAWHWMGGDTLPNTIGLYGSKTLSNNKPGSRDSYACWKDAAGSLWLFGGEDASGAQYNDLWKYNPSTRTFTWVSGDTIPNSLGNYNAGINVINPSSAPGARSGHAGFADASGNFWIFGGRDAYGGYYNDLWKYVPSTNRWVWISGDAGAVNSMGVYGKQGSPDAGNVPGARVDLCGGVDPSGNIWLFGGMGVDGLGNLDRLNDLWKYAPSTQKWTWISGDANIDVGGNYGTKGAGTSTTKPGARNQQGGWVDASGNFWLFGGNGYASRGTGLLNDLWEYNSNSNMWIWMSGSSATNGAASYGKKSVTVGGNMPGARIKFAGGVDPSGNYWIYGGNGYDSKNGNGNLSDLWKYAPGSNQWTWIAGDNTVNHATVFGQPGIDDPSYDPGARAYLGGWVDGAGNFWLMSGSDQLLQDWGDLWEFNYNLYQSAATSNPAGTWTWIAGNSGVNSSGRYNRMGFYGASNQPGAREGQCVWLDKANRIWMFGGSGYDGAGSQGGLSDTWVYNPGNGQWAWAAGDTIVNQAGEYGSLGPKGRYTPGARTLFASCVDNTGNPWIFGGRGYDDAGRYGYLDDLWQLGGPPPLYAWIAGDSIVNRRGYYGQRGEPAGVYSPGGRWQSSMCADNAGNILVFAGQGYVSFGDFGQTNDLWKYNPGSNQWTYLVGSPSPDDNEIFGFPKTKGVPYPYTKYLPNGRREASVWCDAAGNFWFFGGIVTNTYPVAADHYFNDMWRFDPIAKTWTWFTGGGNTIMTGDFNGSGVYGTMGIAAAANTPGARYQQKVALDKAGNVWLYGGIGYDANGQLGILSDLWKYTPGTNLWTWMGGDKTVNSPPSYELKGAGNIFARPGARANAAFWMDAAGNLWLSGGSDYQGKDKNDLWELTGLPVIVPLPIKEVKLQGTAQENQTNLTWQTIGELNTASFDIQRSTNGAGFSSIGTATAVGNGDNDYSYVDNSLPANSNTFYYRLKMVDRDGTFSYSETVVLHRSASNGVTVYPNPATDAVTLQISGNGGLMNTRVKLLDISGRLLDQQLITGPQQILPLGRAGRGIVLLQFADGTVLKVLKE